MTDIVLDVRDLQVEFPTDSKRVIAVDGISFELKRGQTLGIVGESGSGKSVTSLAVMGLVPKPGKITDGEIWFSGIDANGTAVRPVDLLRVPPQKMPQYRGNNFAMIFQEPMSSLNPVYTIGFQLTEAIRQHQKVNSAQARRLAIACLQEVKLFPSDEELEENLKASSLDEGQLKKQINRQKLAMLDRYPHQLSGGQMQRVMIAMAISCNPAVLIADEPTTALDVTVQATILNLLRELRDKRGMSMLFITHDLGVIAEIADVVAVMYRGKIVEYAPVLEIFSNPQHPYTKGLLACRPRLDSRRRYLPTVSDFMEVVESPTGVVLEIKEKPVNPANIVDTGNPQQISQVPLPANWLPPTPLLGVRNLRVGFPAQGMFGQTKRYFWAVNDVSFSIYKGETLGLVGESGCGKSTLARALLRLIEPMGGEVLFEGENILSFTDRRLRELRREMQIIFQNPFSSLDPRMAIGQAVLEPLLIHGFSKNPRTRRDRIAELLEDVGLDPNSMRRYPHEFSGGQRQRVCIARALALNPKFIICDESVSALDVSVQAQVLNLLKNLQAKYDLTYIFISHDLSVVKFMSDDIMVMNKGKIEEISPSEKIYRKPEKEYTRRLIASIPTGTLERIQEQQAGRTG